MILGVCLLDEFGNEPGGTGRAVGLDVAVADGLAGQFGDAGGDEVGVGGGVVHALASAVAVEPVADVEVLLEVVPEREVQERALGGGQLHGGGQPALDDGQVAGAQMLVEAVDVAVHLEAGSRGKAAGSMRGPVTTIMRSSGIAFLASG